MENPPWHCSTAGARGLVFAAAAVATLITGPLSTSASASATFFRTVENRQAGTQLAITSTKANSPLTFVSRFDGVAICATCGVPDTPRSRRGRRSARF
ncbi:hypothetical protein V2I01_17805 [Micromonospora sp. BRA006-A]|nr:hypothetical protein [Micromonospora sp. BRA006-A]